MTLTNVRMGGGTLVWDSAEPGIAPEGIALQTTKTVINGGRRGGSVIGVVALIYLTYILWAFLVARDVIRTRRAVSTSVSLLWILVALCVPFGIIAWIIYRRALLRREAQGAKSEILV